MQLKNFLIETDSFYIVEDKIEEIKKEFNIEEVESYYLDEMPILSIVADLNMPSFFNENKLIIIKDASNIENIKEKEYNEFINYLKNPSEFAVIVLIYDGQKTKKRFNELKNLTIYYSKFLKNTNILDFINDYLSENQFKVDKNTLEYLTSYTFDHLMMKNILDSLICYKYDEKTFNKDDILKILNKPLESNIYDLANYVLNGDIKGAYNLYSDLKLKKISINYMMYLLLDRFTLLYDAYYLISNGYTNSMIANVLNVKEGMVYYLLKDLRNTNIRKVRKIMNDLIKLDYDIKSGIISDELGFEKLLLSI